MPNPEIRETVLYPFVLHQSTDAWGYHSPEFGGGSAPSCEGALVGAQELLDNALDGLVERKDIMPVPSSPDTIDTNGGQVIWLHVRTVTANDPLQISMVDALALPSPNPLNSISPPAVEAVSEEVAQWWYFLSRQQRREWTDQVKRMCFNQGLDAPETEGQISQLAYECDNA